MLRLLAPWFPLALVACAGAPAIEGRFIERAEVDPASSAPSSSARSSWTRPRGSDPLAQAVQRLSSGHVLRAGAGSVLQLYRQRFDGESEQRAFELVTIALPAKLSRGRIEIHEKALAATYSYSSGDERLEAHGRSFKIEGVITLHGQGSGLLAELEADAFLDGGYRRRLSWNAQIPGTALYDFRAWPASTWTQGIWFLERDAPAQERGAERTP